jgi:hypothetical protein
MPSVADALDLPNLPEAMEDYVDKENRIYRCVSDSNPENSYTTIDDETPAGESDKTFYDAEGISYYFSASGHRLGSRRGNGAWRNLANDFSYFHGKKAAIGSVNKLFGDMHVESVDKNIEVPKASHNKDFGYQALAAKYGDRYVEY